MELIDRTVLVRNILRPMLLAAAICLCLETSMATTFVVNSTADAGDASPGDDVCETATGNGVCTLRAAVQEAGAVTTPNTIVVPPGTYNLSTSAACTYMYVGNPAAITETMSALCIRGNVTITGAGAGSTIIDAGGGAATGSVSFRAMVISADATLSLSGVTIQHGFGTGGLTIVGGGGIINEGDLTLTNSVLTLNVAAAAGGGGITNDGVLVMDSTTVSSNTAAANGGTGGGLRNTGTATITASTFSLNSASGGGGIYNGNVFTQSALNISTSTLSGNNVQFSGGGISNDGAMTLTNVTVSGNTGNAGAGIFQHSGPANLNSVTVAFNHAQESAGGVNGSVTVRNTIIANNLADEFPLPDCSPDPSVSQGHNLIQHISGCTFSGNTASDIYGQDPLLGALASNGGPTQTHALQAGSPALDAGDPSTPGTGGTSCPAGDQRGILRPQNAHCDIGAFERVAGLSVTGILPAHAGNSGPAVVVASGSGFQPGAAITLRRSGQPVISGGTAAVEDGNAAMAESIDLTGAAPGQWDVVVTDPDGTNVTLPGGFAVETARTPQVWAQMAGPNAQRAGQTAVFTILYGNSGNVEADAVPLDLSVPANLALTALFPLAPPPPQTGQVLSDPTLAPLYVQPGPELGVVNVPLLIPVIPAGSSGALQITLTIPSTAAHGSTFTLSASAGNPSMNPALDPTVLSQAVTGAEDYAQNILGLTIPASQIQGLNQYATNQYQNAVAAGRAALVANLGTVAPVYSLSQFTIDLALFGTASSGAAPLELSRADRHGDALEKLAGRRRVVERPMGGSKPCTATNVLTEGTTKNKAAVALMEMNLLRYRTVRRPKTGSLPRSAATCQTTRFRPTVRPVGRTPEAAAPPGFCTILST